MDYQIGRHTKSYDRKGGRIMTREELKSWIEKLMRQYSDEEIDGATYFSRMMELITSAQEELDED